MKIYVFGNEDVVSDRIPKVILENIKKDLGGTVNFQFVKPNEEFLVDQEEHVVILDSVKGLEAPALLTEADVTKLELSPRVSVHDYDLSFQLKYLKKLGKIKKVSIIGIPYGKEVAYSPIQLIVKKLVAQDMHGS
jgi:Ni,Fe-hydrogenase maturation factor